MKLLLHVCCGICLSCVLDKFRKDFEVKGFWFNPNIHPLEEYMRRLDSIRMISSQLNLPLEEDLSYPLREWLNSVLGWQGKRCEICYRSRLEAAAKQAKKAGFEKFTTTILTSPHQDFELCKSVGIEVGKKEGVEFFVYDFRDNYWEKKKQAKEAGCYSQKYCGCIFSEEERMRRKLSG